MSHLHWFIIGVIVLAGLGYWNYQRTSGQLKALEAAGFIISDKLKGTPELLVSSSQKQIAVIHGTGYKRYDFDQITFAEVIFDEKDGSRKNFRLKIELDRADKSKEIIRYQMEQQADSALKTLDKLVNG